MNAFRATMKQGWILAIALAIILLVLPSVAAAQGVVRPPCQWMDVGPERLQADQPGKVTAGPLLTPGSHTVWVAAKRNDPSTPYALWTGSGPFDVKAGQKYLVRVEDGSPPRVTWEAEPARLSAYRNPGSMGAVYFVNATKNDTWYGVAVCLGGGGVGADVKIEMQGFRFGITVSNGKQLTYSKNGSTNSTVVKIDGLVTELGHPNGKVVEPYNPLPNGGARSVWIMNNVRFTQLLEPVASQTGAIDTVKVRWLIRNEEFKPHRVGLRLQLDTLIGQNDGVPFTVPGLPGLVTTTADFPKQGPVPHFIQALEAANLKTPGTVAHLSLKLGGRTEAPGRLCLTHWPGFNFLDWEVPERDLTGDSAVALYWPESVLQQNEEREIGFSYGLGDVKSSEGRIGTTTVTRTQSGDEFPITAYVNDPAPGETLTLVPPAAIKVLGPATVPVPAPPIGSKDRTSVVTWKANATKAGSFEFTIRSSSGESQKQTIAVEPGTPIVQKDGTPVQRLIQQLQSADVIARLSAAKDLGKLGATAEPAIPALEKASRDDDEDVRRVSQTSLRTIRAALATGGPSDRIQGLIRDLQNPNEIARLRAAKELGRLGSAAREALPALQKASQDPDADVRMVAANSIRLIQGATPPNETLQKLIQQLGSTDELIRMVAAKELAKLGSAASDAVPALQKLLQDPDLDVRRVAANAIERIQGSGPPLTTATSVAGTIWNGTESLSGFGKLTFQFEADGKAVMIDAQSKVNGDWTQSGNQVTITFKNCVYSGTIQGQTLAGTARYTTGSGANWTFSVTRGAAAPPPAPGLLNPPAGNDRSTTPIRE